MKHIALFIFFYSSLINSFGQFADTASLRAFIRDTIKDQRPEKVTAAQLQKALLGISQFLTAAVPAKLTVSGPFYSGFQFNINNSGPGDGIYIGAVSSSGGYMTSGAAFNGPNFVAKSTNATVYEMNAGNGNIAWYSNTGLTPETPFYPARVMALTSTGRLVIGNNTSPTARLHLPAGTATAGTAPLKFTAGANLTAPEAGAMEWDGTNIFVTQTIGPVRKTVAYTTDIPSMIRLTGSGSGVATTISIPHGLPGITTNSIVVATAANTASALLAYVTIDETNVNFVYGVPPANGTNNLSWNVYIKP